MAALAPTSDHQVHCWLATASLGLRGKHIYEQKAVELHHNKVADGAEFFGRLKYLCSTVTCLLR